MTPSTLGFLVVGIFWPEMWMLRSKVTSLVHVVKIVAEDLGTESLRLRSTKKDFSRGR